MAKTGGKGWRLNWLGDRVYKNVIDQVVIPAMSDFALDVEGSSKRQLRPGHGKLTGTMQRSIHAAEPGYAWSKDDVPPGRSSPQRGGKKVLAKLIGNRVSILVGSGLKYALPLHQGHGKFSGIPFLTDGLKASKGRIKSHLERYRL